jgi:iron complex transport system permease protein
VIPAAVLTLLALLVLITLAGDLDALRLGDEAAQALGMHTGSTRMILLLLSALLAGAAVSICGLLSFVGLLVPHTVRRLGISESKHLLPLCALFGAGFVTLCDTLARTVLAPYELPVGIIMAFLGAPFFIVILVKGRGGVHHD